MQARVRVGTSGYQYEHWKGVFYPENLPKKSWFAHYARHFDTVEINNTFYRLPEANTFDSWRDQAPQDFVYALKFSRYGSHLKRLKDPEATIGRFVERSARLNAALGPTLVQIPPRWGVDAERLAAFLEAAPRNRRWAVEFRDPSWLCDAVYAVLEAQQAALCVHDMIADHPRRVTTNWTYTRFHGDHYRGSYSPQFLAAEADRIHDQLATGLDAYVYFNNDEAGHAVANAKQLKQYLDDT